MDKALQRLAKKTTVENLWLYLLSLLSEESVYAYEINRKLKTRFGFSAGEVTAYVVLYKLEKSGFVETEWKNEGRRRKYYRITPKGKNLLSDGIRLLEKQLENIRGRA